MVDQISDLLIDLDATEEQLDYPLFYADGRAGIAKLNLEDESSNLHVLFDAIIREIPAPGYESAAPFQMLVSDLSYSDFLGRLAIGKVINGSVRSRDALVCLGDQGRRSPVSISSLQVYEGPVLKEAKEAVTSRYRRPFGDRRCPYRRYHLYPGGAEGPAADCRGRAHGLHALHGQHLPFLGH